VPGLAYMHWIGVLGAGFGKFSGHALPPSVWHQDLLQRLVLYPRQAIGNEWLPYIPLLWYAAWRGQLAWRRRAVPPAARATDWLLAFGLLYLVVSSILSVQPLSILTNRPREFAPLKAMLAYWLWVRSRWAGGAALAAMLLTNALTYPFNTVSIYSRESILGPRLLQHAAAIHQPYGHPLDEAIGLLDEHAADGDLIYAPPFHYRETMAAANGDRFFYCCHLDLRDERARAIAGRLPGTHLTANPLEADWQLQIGQQGQLEDELMFHYELFAHGERSLQFTQGPEPSRHLFQSPPDQNSFLLLKKRPGAAVGALP
ncbi:MAG: hypothetical protein ISN26_04455, partial [Betaproteobacteria bacterium AqS2]|nr:hypothetical protein [Betaproteobacteria bacterium AqS2]